MPDGRAVAVEELMAAFADDRDGQAGLEEAPPPLAPGLRTRRLPPGAHRRYSSATKPAYTPAAAVVACTIVYAIGTLSPGP